MTRPYVDRVTNKGEIHYIILPITMGHEYLLQSDEEWAATKEGLLKNCINSIKVWYEDMDLIREENAK
jgi:hypothetical protein